MPDLTRTGKNKLGSREILTSASHRISASITDPSRINNLSRVIIFLDAERKFRGDLEFTRIKKPEIQEFGAKQHTNALKTFFYPDCTVDSGIAPDPAQCSWVLPPIGNWDLSLTLPRRILNCVFSIVKRCTSVKGYRLVTPGTKYLRR